MRNFTTRIPKEIATTMARQSSTDTKRSIDLGIGCLVVALNIVEIIMLLRSKQKKIYECLLLSLSVADMLFGVSNIVLSALYLTDSVRFANAMDISYTTYFFFILTSILHLFWITVDRVWLVFYPLRHRFHVTKRRLYYLLAFTWVTTSCIAISMYLYEHLEYEGQDSSTDEVAEADDFAPARPGPRGEFQTNSRFTLSVIIVVADAVLVTCYSMVVYKVNAKQKFTQSTIASVQDKVSFICILVASVFVVFTLPFAANTFHKSRVPVWANSMLVINSGLNSLIYFFRGWFERLKGNKKAGPETATPTPTPTPRTKLNHETKL